MPFRRVLLLLSLGATAVSAQERALERYVRSVAFHGNQSISDDALRAAIATQQAPFLYRFGLTRWLGLADAPVYDPATLRRDVLRVQAFYGIRGYPNAAVDTTIARHGNDLDITFRIAEGAPVIVETIRLLGLDSLEGLEHVVERLPLQPGQPFDRIAFRTSASVLEAILHDRGHPFARVTGGFTASADAQSVALEFDAAAGPRARIGQIEITGTKSIDDRVILETARLAPGELYSDSALYDGRSRLVRTDFFRSVEVGLADSMAERGTDSLVDVRIRVRLAESPLQRVRVSAGYGTLDCFRSMASAALFNFAGHGRRLELRAGTAQLGVGEPADWGFERGLCPWLADEDTSRLKLNYHLSATLVDPLLRWKRVSGTATLYAERQTVFGSYLREALGAEAALSYELAPQVHVRGGYSLAYGRTLATPAAFCALLRVCLLEDQGVFRERRRRATLTVGFSRDGTNSLIDPVTGSAFKADLRWSSPLFGSDRLARFTSVTAEFAAHRPLGETGAVVGRVLSWRLAAGAVFAPRQPLPSGQAIYVPPEERMYAGGSRTIRGFAQNHLGPIVHVIGSDGTVRSSATGGTAMGLANVELRMPLRILGMQLVGALFVDAGLVGELRRVQWRAWRVTPGAGLRIPSILGPIRIDVGFNPYPARRGPLYRLVGTELQLVEEHYRPMMRFIDRFQLHLAIGQSF